MVGKPFFFFLGEETKFRKPKDVSILEYYFGW